MGAATLGFMVVMTICVAAVCLTGYFREALEALRRGAQRFPPGDTAARLVFLGLGPCALLCLTISYAEIIPLWVAFCWVVVPAYGTMLAVGVLAPSRGRLALIGFLSGFLATIVYDGVRLALVYGSRGVDPIPHIGDHLLGTGSPWWVGYIWRLYGNGAGLGIVFAMLPKRLHTAVGGLVYGTVVGTGMLGALYFFPQSQAHLFILGRATVVNGFFGHWAYGATLGALMSLAARRRRRRGEAVIERLPVVLPEPRVEAGNGVHRRR